MSTSDSSNKLSYGNTKHKTKSDELYQNWFDSLIKQIDQMENVEWFIKDNHIREYKLKSHIMYKVNLGTSCQLKQKGKNYEYEFVVEFDTETPEYGIYYGCRAIINRPNDQHIQKSFPYQPSHQITDEELNSAINDINKDWIEIKPKIQEILKNVFPYKKWSDMAFRPTNNASDDTYWAFWIAVGDDDDIIEVVARTTRLIANAYSLHFCDKPLFNSIDFEKFKKYYKSVLDEVKPVVIKKGKITTEHTKTRLTKEAFRKSLINFRRFGKQKYRDSDEFYNKEELFFSEFIEYIEENFIQDMYYEFCWSKKVDQNSKRIFELVNDFSEIWKKYFSKNTKRTDFDIPRSLIKEDLKNNRSR